MEPRIAVLGAGALGAPIAGQLSAAGHDVVMIDPWTVHVEAVRAKGLRITTGPWDDPDDRRIVPLRTMHLFEAAAEKPRFDVVVLASKSYDSRWLAQFIEPYLDPEGVVVSIQNSLNDEWVAPIVGKKRDVGCVLMAGGGELVGPGDTWRDQSTNRLLLGELDGKLSDRLKQLASILSATANIDFTDNIWGAKWSKLVQTAMAGAFAGATGGRSRAILADEHATRIAHRIGVEAVQVGLALGLQLVALKPGSTIEEAMEYPEKWLPSVETVKAPGKEAHNFIYQDLLRGRRTEIDFINGLVCAKGKEVGIPTPANARAVELIHRLERGELTSSPTNLRLLEV
jgi:2-dehydropantoate 2-reductase